MWAGLGKFFGEILKALFKPFMQQYKEPTEVESIGFDDEIENDIDAGIDAEFADDSEFDFLSNEAHQEEKDQPNA